MMKHKGFLTGIFSVLLVFGLVLAGCGGDDPDDDPRGEPILGETFEITGKVHGRSERDNSVTPLTNVTAVTVNGPFDTALTATVTGGDFTVTIPAADQTKLNTPTKSDLASKFDLSDEDKITTLSPADAKFGELSFSATAEGWYNPALRLGTNTESGTETNSSERGTNYSYVYVDKDVTVRGSEREQGEEDYSGKTYVYDYSTTIDLSLKAGWNVVEESYSYNARKISDTKYETNGTTTYSVKGVPASAKWYLDD